VDDHEPHRVSDHGCDREELQRRRAGYLTDLWVPPTTDASARILPIPAYDRFVVCGRLKAGVHPEQVREVPQATFTNFRQEQVGTVLLNQQLRHRDRTVFPMIAFALFGL